MSAYTSRLPKRTLKSCITRHNNDVYVCFKTPRLPNCRIKIDNILSLNKRSYTLSYQLSSRTHRNNRSYTKGITLISGTGRHQKYSSQSFFDEQLFSKLEEKDLFEKDGSLKENYIIVIGLILGALAYFSSPLYNNSASAQTHAEVIEVLQEMAPPQIEKNTWGLFWDLIKEEWLPFVLSIIACFGTAFLESLVMRVGGQLLDLADKGDFDAFKEKALSLLGYIMLQGDRKSVV